MGDGTTGGTRSLAELIGRRGVFGGFPGADPALLTEAAAELAELGFGTVWLGHSTVEEAAPVVAAVGGITVGTAIQSIWRHGAADTAARFAELEAAHPGRFVLGLGVSHPQMVTGYRRPLASMSGYLDELDSAGRPVPAGRRVLAALGPRMLGLAAERAAGALPYLVTSAQVAAARETLGTGPVLAPELGVVLETDPERARALAREALSFYLGLTNYTDNWLRGGFTAEDLSGGGSDRLVDALFAWGDEDRIRARVDEFRAAGADHIAFQLVGGAAEGGLPREGWRRLAALTAAEG
ncbi:LLM class F420-dependent oxidoreductase [Streptomyces sp. TRM 70361]|uniref:LLM class F420-dependent oxidoreductase n=1 Tax=Streptomyces sp. TRM 70361 TaxID=3116553 RepID=UPI002E7B25E0|nr:LLM class F420-dependent oxidoreductase [Streptomyces sp. TRM 70361]MEE1942696.1 LLM class F420-dependent oxidoreductase [Streptomyces sp. TRM 70361]